MALCTSLKSFKLLTSFSFSSEAPTHVTIDFLPLFTSLGDTCQKLISLEFNGDYNSQKLNVDYLLALVLGKKQDLFPQQLYDQLKTDNFLLHPNSPLAHLQFTPESVTPICSTLQQLDIHGLRACEMAFVLRHFPQLRKCPFNGQTCEALHLLHKQQQQPPKISSLSTSQRSSEDRDIVRWNLNAPFQGTVCFLTN